MEQFLIPTLRPGDIVVFANLGSHKGRAIRQAIREAGAHRLFLPPHSPDLDAIEQVFATRAGSTAFDFMMGLPVGAVNRSERASERAWPGSEAFRYAG